jgi:hypothetical protein
MASSIQTRHFLLGSILIIVIVVVVLVWSRSIDLKPELQPDLQPELQSEFQPESGTPATTTIRPVMQPEMRPSGLAPSPPTGTALPVWSRIEMDSNTPGVPVLKEGVTDAVLVSFDLLPANLEQGDPVNIEIPQIQKNYITRVSRVKRDEGDNSSISGYLMGDGNKKYRFMITIGKSNTFAHINTPEGSFELVGNKKMGWLMPVAAMTRNKNYNKPDYVVLKSQKDTSPEQEE